MQFVYNSYVLTVNQYIDAFVTTNICCTLDIIRIPDILSLCYIPTIIVDSLWYKKVPIFIEPNGINPIITV